MKNKLSKLTLIFDNDESRKSFVAGWLDGGLDGGGNLDWDTDYKESSKWDKEPCTKLRIKGTGDFLDDN